MKDRGPNAKTRKVMETIKGCFEAQHNHNLAELVACCGDYKVATVKTAIRRLKEDPELPRPYRVLLNQYGYAADPEAGTSYKNRELRYCISRVGRLHSGTIVPMAKIWPTASIKRSERHLEIVLDDLRDLLSQEPAENGAH